MAEQQGKRKREKTLDLSGFSPYYNIIGVIANDSDNSGLTVPLCSDLMVPFVADAGYRPLRKAGTEG